MDSKIRNIISGLFAEKNRLKLFVIAGIIGIMIILLSELVPTGNDTKVSAESGVDYSQYIENLEDRTEKLISSIHGVGKCRVMITLANTDESVYAKNIDEKSSDSSYSKNSEYVLYEADNGDEPVLIKQYFPKIQGVAVVCQGGDNVVVREQIISSISSLFDISSSKISVSKISE